MDWLRLAKLSVPAETTYTAASTTSEHLKLVKIRHGIILMTRICSHKIRFLCAQYPSYKLSLICIYFIGTNISRHFSTYTLTNFGRKTTNNNDRISTTNTITSRPAACYLRIAECCTVHYCLSSAAAPQSS